MNKFKLWPAILALLSLVAFDASAYCTHGTTCGESDTAQLAVPDDWENSDDWTVPNKYIVDFEDDLEESEITETLSSYGLTSVDGPYWEGTKMEIVTVTPGQLAAVQSLLGHEDIEGVEPQRLVRALTLHPDDPLYDKQWHMKKVNVEDAWHLSVGRGVTVAVIDTGVACEDRGGYHKVSDLKGTRCVPGWNVINNNDHAFDDHGHGTHVAGTIAQTTNNGLGGVGIAFGVDIMPVKVLAGNGSGTLDGVAAGIIWAADNGAHIINMSLGGPGKSKVLQRAVNHARSKGVTVIAAAGNSGGSVGSPANCDGVVAVSATDQNDSLASFSSRGPEVDIGAPGVNVTQNTICDQGRNGCEDFPAWNGTSMATPHVAGVAALLVGQGISDPDAIESYLKGGALELDTSKRGREYFGAGRLQAAATVENAHWKQVALRGFLLLLLAFVAFEFAKTRGQTFRFDSPEFWATGVLTSVGAFFLPLFLSRHSLWVDLVSRPLGDWTILAGTNLHQYLPLANVLLPLGAAALFLKSHHGAGKWIGGLFVGTAAYLTSTVLMNNMFQPFGWAMTTAWALGNAALCVYIGGLVLGVPKRSVVPEPEHED